MSNTDTTNPETITLVTGRDRRPGAGVDQIKTAQIAVGEFLSEPLVSDTVVWEVTKVTAKTITVRSTVAGQVVESDHRDGNPFPVNYSRVLPDPGGIVRTLRVRTDGTVRLGAHRGARPMYPTPRRGGVPVQRRDWRD